MGGHGNHHQNVCNEKGEVWFLLCGHCRTGSEGPELTPGVSGAGVVQLC